MGWQGPWRLRHQGLVFARIASETFVERLLNKIRVLQHPARSLGLFLKLVYCLQVSRVAFARHCAKHRPQASNIAFHAQVQGLERPPGALDARPVRMGLRAAFAQVQTAVYVCVLLLALEQL